MKLTLNGLFDSNNRRPESVEAEFVVNDVTYKTKLTGNFSNLCLHKTFVGVFFDMLFYQGLALYQIDLISGTVTFEDL